MFEISAPPPDEDVGSRVLPRAFIRAASRVADMVALATLRASRSVTLAELVDLPEGEGFTALLRASEGPPGLVIFDPVVFSSVIEAMTIGAVTTRGPALRRATLTDAALMGELVDALLAEVDANPDPAEPYSAGFRMGRLADDLRLLDVMLEDVPFALTVLEVELLAEGGTRQGQVIIALPAPVPELLAFADFDMGLDVGPVHDEAWEQALEASVMGAPTQMNAVLGRVRLPLAEVLALGVDSRLTLPLSQLEEVQLETLDHKAMALGRLGQYRGMRALRLMVMPDGKDIDPPYIARHETATDADGGAAPAVVSEAPAGLGWSQEGDEGAIDVS
ncbi:MAG: FliM/FliN family flagellar motor switch protein [Pararhodobacter sp.]|nr:FliM/FliN family flagellar motor switch protein [Pararhodobacter sp.]